MPPDPEVGLELLESQLHLAPRLYLTLEPRRRDGSELDMRCDWSPEQRSTLAASYGGALRIGSTGVPFSTRPIYAGP